MKVTANGIQLNYAIDGEGPWVVMSHSLACSLEMWDPQVAALKAGYKVLRFDTRGHGAQRRPGRRPTPWSRWPTTCTASCRL